MYVAMRRLLIILALITVANLASYFAHHCPRFRAAKPGPPPAKGNSSGPPPPGQVNPLRAKCGIAGAGWSRCARSPSRGWLASTRFGRRCTRRLSTPPAEALQKN